MNERWHVLSLDTVDPIAVAGVNWKPLRRPLGLTAFGLNAYVGNAGEHVVERHTEESLGHEEVYVVVAGHATFTLDDDTLDAPSGSVVFVSDPSVRREAHATVDGTIVLAIGGKPGEAYSPSAWETYFAVERYRPTMDTAAAIAELEAALEEHPEHAGVIYSLGCWHALAGHDDEALVLVRRAIELDPRNAEWASNDDDLASIRDRL
jgi:tetratricopeptide (TPR) repeat protein